MHSYDRLIVCLVVAGWGLASVVGAESVPIKIKVLKNNVNLRAKPVATSEVVGQLTEGTILSARTLDKDWVELVPPLQVDGWVLTEYVKEGAIQSKQKVNVRSGPGINYSIMGQLNQGDTVEQRGAHQEWAKIAPPNSCSVWVSRSMVLVLSDKPEAPVKAETHEPAAVAAVRPTPGKPAMDPAAKAPIPEPTVALQPTLPPLPPASAPTLAVDVLTPPHPEPPVDLDLVPTPGQGQAKEFTGVLRPKEFLFRSPSPFRLVVYDSDQRPTTLCFIKGNSAQLNGLMNRTMTIIGREYWVKAQKFPVLVPERIVLK